MSATNWILVPAIPTEQQWSGLARALMLCFEMVDGKKPRHLLRQLEMMGERIPQWLLDEPEMKSLDSVLSKGTRCVLIYRAMLAARPEAPDWEAMADELAETLRGDYETRSNPQTNLDVLARYRAMKGK